MYAHAPLGEGNNENISSATIVPDPTKSWAIYADLHEGGEAQYYRFDILQGQKIHVSLFTTTSVEDATFTPGMILMGPGISGEGTLPAYIQVSPGAGVISVEGIRAPVATYEGFAPSVFIELADISLEAPVTGTYYIAVYNPVRGGNYGLAIGDRESFTLSEWIMTPFSLLLVYQWERQSLPSILAPAVALFLAGAVLIFLKQEKDRPLDMPGLAGCVAGLLFLGTGATVFSQMIFAVRNSSPDSFLIITILFTVIPIILGLAILRLAFHYAGQWSVRSRAWLLVMGVLGLMAWAGYIFGPILAGAAAVLPSRERKEQ